MNAKVILVTNQKGGVGKTTTTVELAACFANMEKKVLVIDFDSSGNSTKSSGGKKEHSSVYEVLTEKCAIMSSVQQLPLFDLIGSNESLSYGANEFSTEKDPDNIYRLLDMIDSIRDRYDYIFIDSCPSESMLLSMVYVAADYVIVPAEADENSLEGIGKVENNIKKLRDGRTQFTKAKIIAIILTRYESRPSLHSFMLNNFSSLADAIGGVYVDKVRKSIVCNEAKSAHECLQSYAKESSSARDYRRIAMKLIEKIESEK